MLRDNTQRKPRRIDWQPHNTCFTLKTDIHFVGGLSNYRIDLNVDFTFLIPWALFVDKLIMKRDLAMLHSNSNCVEWWREIRELSTCQIVVTGLEVGVMTPQSCNENMMASWNLNISRSPVNSPHKGQWRGALIRPLICAWIKTEQIIETRVMWDAIALIMRSLY